MSSINCISIQQLARLVGTPRCPALLDVRSAEEFAAEPRLIPASLRWPAVRAPSAGDAFRGRAAVVICSNGGAASHGVAALLRQQALSADVLEGGLTEWKEAGLPLVPDASLPRRDERGRTVWVTRERPKIDRIACPWLIRRFVDTAATFLFVKPSEVVAVAERFNATPFDIEGVRWSHRGELCTFDVMIEEFALKTRPLLRLAAIVRAADTARLDLAPQAAGFLAAALGLSRMHDDDLAQLEGGMLLCDAFYRWSRDASDETHDWPTSKSGRSR